jgi:hypothetical protein
MRLVVLETSREFDSLLAAINSSLILFSNFMADYFQHSDKNRPVKYQQLLYRHGEEAKFHHKRFED